MYYVINTLCNKMKYKTIFKLFFMDNLENNYAIIYLDILRCAYVLFMFNSGAVDDLIQSYKNYSYLFYSLLYILIMSLYYK